MKGMAVSQIILLVLGILVLAVVAYLLYTNFVTTSGTISAEICRAEATRACTGCAIAAGSFTVDSCLFDAGKPDKPSSLKLCQDQGNLRARDGGIDCAQYIGGGTGGGGGGAGGTGGGSGGSSSQQSGGASQSGGNQIVNTVEVQKEIKP